MRKGPGSGYDKWDISMVIYDTDSPQRSTKWWLQEGFGDTKG